jgi:VCPO second helical-bundle domain
VADAMIDADSGSFGYSHTYPAGASRVEPSTVPAHDITLYWATFSEAADQAGLSRRYGGIHFVKADLVGRVIGRQVAAQAWDKSQSYITASSLGKEQKVSTPQSEQGERIDYERGLPPPPRMLPYGELRPVIEPAFRDQEPPRTQEEVEEWEPFPSGPLEHVLTDELAQRAEQVALASPEVRRLLAEKRYIAIGASLMDEGDEKPEGEARAQAGTLIFMIYNYTDNMAIQVTLDRNAQSVIRAVERFPDPCPPRSVEIDQAVTLARQDHRLAEHLTEDMEGTAIMVTMADPAHPLYRHRLFDVRFGYSDERLPRQMALVDLSDERVVRAGPVVSTERPHEGRE